MIGKSLVLLATLLLALGACDGAVTLQRCLQSTKKVLPSPFTLPTLRVHWGEWTTMQLSTSVAAILLSEKMGFDVQLVDGKTSKQAYEDLAEGEIHLSFEAWPKSNQAEFDRFTKQFEPAEEPGQVAQPLFIRCQLDCSSPVISRLGPSALPGWQLHCADPAH